MQPDASHTLSEPVKELTERLLESIWVFEKCGVASFEYLQMMIGKLFKGGFAALQWNHDIVFRPCQQHRATDFVLEGPNPPLSHNTSPYTLRIQMRISDSGCSSYGVAQQRNGLKIEPFNEITQQFEYRVPLAG